MSDPITNSYETIFIINPELGEDSIKALVEKFTNLISSNGTISETAEWGKKKLAYPIDDLNEGYYVLVNFDAPANFIAELERIYNITDGLMRSLVIRK